MDLEYGINIANKFDCLVDDDNDPEETVAVAATRAVIEMENREKEALKAAKKAKEEQKKAEKVEKVAAPPSAGKENRPDGGQRGGGRGGGVRGGRGRGGPRTPRESHEAGEPVVDGNEVNTRPPRGEGFPRGGGRGARGGIRNGVREFRRGGGAYNAHHEGEHVEAGEQNTESPNNTVVAGDHADRPPREQRGRGGFGRGRGRGGEGDGSRRGRFDRHSGSDKTGVKPTEKRHGSGRGNWGTADDDLEAANEPVANAEEKAVVEGGDAEEIKEEAPKPPPQPEEKTITLEEWKRQQAKKESPQFNVRKPIEPKGVGKVLASKKFDDQHEEELVIVEKRPAKKQVIALDFKSTSNESRGNYRGGRGGPRGGGDYRGGRGGRGGGAGRGRGQYTNNEGHGKHEATLNMEEFPALG